MSKRKTVKRLFEQWVNVLGLRWWQVDVYYLSEPNDVLQHLTSGEADTTVLARTYSDWRYSEASIYVNMPAVQTLNDNEAERLVVHELCHILVSEMRENEAHHEERVVTGLQKAFMWTAEYARSCNDTRNKPAD